MKSLQKKILNPTVQILKGTDLTGLLGGHKRKLEVKSPGVVQGQSPSRGAGDESLSFFRETTYNICIKIQQTTVVAVTG